jgi:predicted DNA-binding transcriptional regulator AlpA
MDTCEKSSMASLSVPSLLTRSDLQTVLRLSSRTIGRLVANGGLPQPVRVGQSYRWRVSEIEQFIENPSCPGNWAVGTDAPFISQPTEDEIYD